MVSSRARTVEEYLRALPAHRRKEIEAVRAEIRGNLPEGVVEMMDFGMIYYAIPLSVAPDTYNGHPLPIAGLACQKHYNSVYLMSVYADPRVKKWFVEAYRKSGKSLDMGQSCVRFHKAEDLPSGLIGEAVAKVSVADFVTRMNKARSSPRKTRSSSRPPRSRAGRRS